MLPWVVPKLYPVHASQTCVCRWVHRWAGSQGNHQGLHWDLVEHFCSPPGGELLLLHQAAQKWVTLLSVWVWWCQLSISGLQPVPGSWGSSWSACSCSLLRLTAWRHQEGSANSLLLNSGTQTPELRGKLHMTCAAAFWTICSPIHALFLCNTWASIFTQQVLQL